MRNLGRFVIAVAFILSGVQAGATTAAVALSDEARITDLIQVLNSKTRLEQVFPQSTKGLTDYEVQAMKTLKAKMGKIPMPHYTSFGRSVRAYFSGGGSVEIKVLQVKPLAFLIGDELYQVQSARDFFDKISAQMGNKTSPSSSGSTESSSANLMWLLMDEASAEPALGATQKQRVTNGTLAGAQINPQAGTAAAGLGLGAMSIRSWLETQKPTILKTTDTQAKGIGAESKVAGLARDFPGASCGDGRAEGFGSDVNLTYRVQDSVLSFDLKSNSGSAPYIQYRKNQLTSDVATLFCEKPNQCTKVDALGSFNLNSGLDGASSQKDLEQAIGQVSSLAFEYRSIQQESRTRQAQPMLSVDEFMQRENIKYEKTSDISEVEKAVLEPRTFDELYSSYMNAQKEQYWKIATEGNGVTKKTKNFMKWVDVSASPMSKEEFRSRLLNTLYVIGLRSRQDKNASYLTSNFLPGFGDLKHPVIQNLRPFAKSADGLRPYDETLRLTAEDEKRYEEAKKRFVQEKAVERVERKSAIPERIKAIIGSFDKANAVSKECQAEEAAKPMPTFGSHRAMVLIYVTPEEREISCLADTFSKPGTWLSSGAVEHQSQVHRYFDFVECCTDKSCRDDLKKLAAAAKTFNSGWQDSAGKKSGRAKP